MNFSQDAAFHAHLHKGKNDILGGDTVIFFHTRRMVRMSVLLPPDGQTILVIQAHPDDEEQP